MISICVRFLAAYTVVFSGTILAESPVIAASVNGANAASLPRGWPLLVRVNVRHPDLMKDASSLLTIQSADGTAPWTSSVHLQLFDSNGAPVNLSFVSADDALPAQVTVDAGRIGAARWTVAPEQTLALPEGDYSLLVSVDWNGATIVAPQVPVTFLKPYDTPTRDQSSWGRRLLANYAIWTKDPGFARSIVDDGLAADSRDIPLLELRGDLALAGGDLKTAFDSYSKALQTFYEQFPNAQEPPQNLHRKEWQTWTKLTEVQ